jgi:hypothetical protein
MKRNELVTLKHAETLSASVPYSNPYWLNKEHAEGLYSVSDRQQIGQPENKSNTFVIADISIQGQPFAVKKPLVYKNVDPVKGEVYRPFEILPALNVNFSARTYAFSNGQNEKIQVEIKSNADSMNGKIHIVAPPGWLLTPDTLSYSLNRNEIAPFEISVTAPLKNSTGTIAALSLNGDTLKNIRRIEYDHVPYQFILGDSKAGVVSFELNKGVQNIGYIPGAGDEVAACLKQIGYHVTVLDKDLLSREDLSQFDAIVTGVRAYNTNDWLQNEYQKLMDYVKQGGNLVVQYNTNNRIGPVVARISPYPFTISRDRVTDENAEVKFINPSHVALNSPNKISQADFQNWKQERGIYFATETDSAYQKIFSMNDAGEKPGDGSLIIAGYGKGNFVYTGIVFFRELPAGIPGAYRLFANLLALPKNE